jgi:hypothetical protein
MISSMIGSGLSSSIYRRMASRAFCLAAGRVDARPFSTMATIVRLLVLRNGQVSHSIKKGE